MKITIINGPNLNLLGKREPEIYGSRTLKEIEEKVESIFNDHNIECEFFQSNSEGEIKQAMLDYQDGKMGNLT